MKRFKDIRQKLLNVATTVVYGSDKEEWEFKWQKKHWVDLFRQPETNAKCREYWVKYRYLNEIIESVNIRPSTRVLDVGCGLSTVLHWIEGERIGVDPLAERYKEVYEYPPEIRIEAAHGESLPFEDSTFDVVFSSNCIDHTNDPTAVIAEVLRVLRSSGWFILTCETFRDDVGRRNAGHPHSMTTEKLRHLLANFDIQNHWQSTWYGMRAYALGEEPTEQIENVFLSRKPSE